MTNPANFLQSLGWAVLNSLWQLALLWLVYQIIIVVFSKTSPAVKSRLASSLLILGFVWFIVTFILVYTETTAGPASTVFFNAYENESVGHWLNKILPAASKMPASSFKMQPAAFKILPSASKFFPSSFYSIH